jgi:L-serine dehydratase
MFLSVFDVFKIGIGPSSSHTMGPMTAAGRFLGDLRTGKNRIPGAGISKSLRCVLHGSLAFTGKGHATDRAVILGLCGMEPATLDLDQADDLEQGVRRTGIVEPPGLGKLRFKPQSDLVFDYDEPLPGHTNGLVLQAFDDAGNLSHERTYYSIGGGFVVTSKELEEEHLAPELREKTMQAEGVVFPFATAEHMLDMARKSGNSIAELKRANEELHWPRHELNDKLDAIWKAMHKCIDRGLGRDGILPGGLKVKRRAKAIYKTLQAGALENVSQPHTVNDWISVYAMAVNEENAGGGRVVTSPTNGAAGVVPAVMRYYRDHCVGSNDDKLRDFLLTAAAIGGLIKHNASISGAEVGCQGEVGSASAMAAAGFCAVMGGTPDQVENAAEIALEHHLGMSCDPVRGLVQVPCIERNALGAVKAVSAASLALHGDGTHYMPLDNCIETMRQTGLDMNEKYKETSTGGLAVNLPEC